MVEKIVFLEYTQEELDLNYDQRRWFPGAQEVIDRYLYKSEKARTELVHQTLRYGEHEDETLDWFPCSNGSSPTMIFIHGGAWLNFSKDDFSFIAAGFLKQSLNVCIPNFSSLRKVRMPEMLERIRRAIVWLSWHAAELGADHNQLHICGHSSGAHLAALTVTTDWSALGLKIRAPIKSASCISGIFDLEPVLLSSRKNYISLTPSEIETLSPIRKVNEVSCPILLAVADRDTSEFKRHSHEYARALQRNQALAGIVHLENKNHFDSIEDIETPTSTLSRLIGGLVQHPTRLSVI